RAGCDRGPIATRHRRHPIARCSGRVVSPTRHAWPASLRCQLPSISESPARAGDFRPPWEAKEILYLITKIKSSIARSIERFGFNNPVLIDERNQAAAVPVASECRAIGSIRDQADQGRCLRL